MSDEMSKVLQFPGRPVRTPEQVEALQKRGREQARRREEEALKTADEAERRLGKMPRVPEQDRLRLARNLGDMVDDILARSGKRPPFDRRDRLQQLRVVFETADRADKGRKDRKQWIRFRDEGDGGRLGAEGETFLALAKAAGRLASPAFSDADRQRAVLRLVAGTSLDAAALAPQRQRLGEQAEIVRALDGVLRRIEREVDLSLWRAMVEQGEFAFADLRPEGFQVAGDKPHPFTTAWERFEAVNFDRQNWPAGVPLYCIDPLNLASEHIQFGYSAADSFFPISPLVAIGNATANLTVEATWSEPKNSFLFQRRISEELNARGFDASDWMNPPPQAAIQESEAAARRWMLDNHPADAGGSSWLLSTHVWLGLFLTPGAIQPTLGLVIGEFGIATQKWSLSEGQDPVEHVWIASTRGSLANPQTGDRKVFDRYELEFAIARDHETVTLTGALLDRLHDETLNEAERMDAFDETWIGRGHPFSWWFGGPPQVYLLPQRSALTFLSHRLHDGRYWIAQPQEGDIKFQPFFKIPSGAVAPAAHNTLGGMIMRNLAHAPEGERLDDVLLEEVRVFCARLEAFDRELRDSYERGVSRLFPNSQK